MRYLEYVKEACEYNIPRSFVIKTTGRFFTPAVIANRIFDLIFDNISISQKKFSLIDPFAGDGRMAYWFISRWRKKCLPNVEWNIYLYDIEMSGLKLVNEQIENLQRSGVVVNVHIYNGDSFHLLSNSYDKYDFVLTNPPWGLIKPDVRVLSFLENNIKNRYIAEMKNYDLFLSNEYPLSQPKIKYAGWGTNLSRVGLELAHRLCKPDGFCGIVLPASFFADEQSQSLREYLLFNNELVDVSYYPSEARLFDGVDFNSCSFVYKKKLSCNKAINVTLFDKELNVTSSGKIRVRENYPIPIIMGREGENILEKMQAEYGTWGDAEQNGNLWAGRELDQTGIDRYLEPTGNGCLFIKGKMIGRYEIIEQPSLYVRKDGWTPPRSCNFHRIVWRDVSRMSQKRRIVATIIPPQFVAGNSLGVAYLRDGALKDLYVLLGIINSICFEFQLKNYLATGHISLSSLRKVSIPDTCRLNKFGRMSEYVSRVLSGDYQTINRIEGYVARHIYKLSEIEFINIISLFPKLTTEEKDSFILAYSEEKIL